MNPVMEPSENDPKTTAFNAVIRKIDPFVTEFFDRYVVIAKLKDDDKVRIYAPYPIDLFTSFCMMKKSLDNMLAFLKTLRNGAALKGQDVYLKTNEIPYTLGPEKEKHDKLNDMIRPMLDDTLECYMIMSPMSMEAGNVENVVLLGNGYFDVTADLMCEAMEMVNQQVEEAIKTDAMENVDQWKTL
jgi:hypothetical protein